MAGGPEPQPGRGGDEQIQIEAIRQEVKNATINALALKSQLDSIKYEADQAEEKINVRAVESINRKSSEPFERLLPGQVGDRSTLKHQVKVTEIHVKEALKAYRANRNLIPVPQDSFGGSLINSLSRNIQNPDLDINPESSPYVYKIINRAINNQINDIDSLTDTYNQTIFLRVHNPVLFAKIRQSFIDVAQDRGVGQKEINNRFGEQQQEGVSNSEEEFAHDWVATLSTFNFSKEDIDVIKSLYSTEKFAHFVGKLKNDSQTGPLNDHDLNEEIERRIVLVFSKLYAKADTERASKFFDEIIQEGFYNSIQIAQILLSRRLYNLRNKFASIENDLPEEIRNTHFFTKNAFRESVDRKVIGEFVKRDEQGRVIKENGKEVMFSNYVPEVKSLPVQTDETVSIARFLMDVETEVGHEIETRKFCHNISALVLRSPDPQKGFWSQIAHYADELGATDIDHINGLPDSDVISSAFSLYSKNIWEAFAANNWIHDPNIFQSMDRGNFNRLQKATLEQLRLMFPHYDEWRLYRAMKLGIGLAQGVYITEQEAAAWADPQIQQSSDVTFRSYYYNDNSALNALNPIHTLLRFFTEKNSKGPILFSLVSGVDQKIFRPFDHRELWLKQQQYRDAFTSGTQNYKRANPFERSLMEVLPNIARVGSLITRDGWSLRPALESWYVYKTEGDLESGNLNYLQTFRSLQYIGYDAINLFFVQNIDSEDNFNKMLAVDVSQKYLEVDLDKDIREKKVERTNREKELEKRQDAYNNNIKERDEFFKYLYRRYVNPDVGDNDSAYNDELNHLRMEATKTVDELRKRVGNEVAASRRLNPFNPRVREELIERETYKKLMYKAQVGILRDRMPTKFVLFDRKRLSKDGLSSWEKLRHSCGWGTNAGRVTMDQSVRDLQLVETIIRRETTKRMNEHLRKKNPTRQTKYIKYSDITFSDFEVFERNYAVTEAVIMKYIKNPQRQENAIKLFKAIQNQYGNNQKFIEEFSEGLREKDILGNMRDRYFPFSVAPEELEKSFLAFKNTGEKVLKRRFGDTSGAETVVFKNLIELLEALHQTAISPERKMDELVKHIGAIQAQIEATINKEYSHKVAYQLAAMVINYFKKDTVGRNILTKYLSNDYRSLAARFAGQNKGVWEWEAREIDQFILELERLRILPTEPYDLSKVKYIEKEPIKLFGKIPLGKKRIVVDPSQYFKRPIKLFGLKIGEIRQIKGDYEYYGAKLRREHGAAAGHLFFEVVNRYLPIFLIFLLYEFIKKSLEKKK